MKNMKITELINHIQKWHKTGLKQLEVLAYEEDADLKFSDRVVPADSDMAQGIRTGAGIALNILGELPFEVTQADGDAITLDLFSELSTVEVSPK